MLWWWKHEAPERGPLRCNQQILTPECHYLALDFKRLLYMAFDYSAPRPNILLLGTSKTWDQSCNQINSRSLTWFGQGVALLAYISNEGTCCSLVLVSMLTRDFIGTLCTSAWTIWQMARKWLRWTLSAFPASRNLAHQKMAWPKTFSWTKWHRLPGYGKRVGTWNGSLAGPEMVRTCPGDLEILCKPVWIPWRK